MPNDVSRPAHHPAHHSASRPAGRLVSWTPPVLVAILTLTAGLLAGCDSSKNSHLRAPTPAADSEVVGETPADLRDLIDARGSSGETELESRGYVNTGGSQGDDRVWTQWWHAGKQRCVTVVTAEGRYKSLVFAPRLDCKR